MLNAPTPTTACLKYIATPVYEPGRFSVLLSTQQTSGCNNEKKKKSNFGPIVGGVVGGVVILSLVAVIVMVLFCKDSRIFRRTGRTRKSSMKMINTNIDATM